MKYNYRHLNFFPLVLMMMLCACLTTNAQTPASPTTNRVTKSVAAQASGSTVPALNFDSLSALAAKSKETMDVELEGATLRMATKFMAKDDEDDPDPEDRAENAVLRAALEGLRGVYVKGYKFDEAGDYAASLDPIRAQLVGAGLPWKRIVNMSDRKTGASSYDRIEVYVAAGGGSEDQFDGLAVLMSEPKGVMVVNVVGKIDIDTILKVAPSIGIPQLKDLNKSLNPPPAGQTRPGSTRN